LPAVPIIKRTTYTTGGGGGVIIFVRRVQTGGSGIGGGDLQVEFVYTHGGDAGKKGPCGEVGDYVDDDGRYCVHAHAHVQYNND